MYLNAKAVTEKTPKHKRLTLTLDVFKFTNKIYKNFILIRLTLTLDVFKYCS